MESGEIDDARAVERLRALVRVPTVSRLDESQTEWARFDEFIDLLPTLYPKTHSALTREMVAGHSLLYRWAGREPGDPAVLMAHYDVVPADVDGWEHPPFGAQVVPTEHGDVVWGRGTLDDKGSLATVLEAVEALAASGFQPKHDLYLSFGHNEETTGGGASAIVDLLEERGVRPRLVLDEGGAVVEGIFPGVGDPIAVVGVSEKGILSLTMTVEQEGGHASTPPRMTATARLARAIVRLNSKPFPKAFTAPNLEMIRTLGARARQPFKWVFTNLWLTRPLLLGLFTRLGDETNAIVRTTGAVTQLQGADAANALAERAVAVVNVRVAVGSSVADAMAHVRRAIRDPKVRLDAHYPNEPSPVSPTQGPAWTLIKQTVEDTYPGTIVTPYIMLGASDSRHFTRISGNVYRFSPFQMSKQERGTLHAMNERIRVSTYLSGVRFYRQLVAGL